MATSGDNINSANWSETPMEQILLCVLSKKQCHGKKAACTK